MPAQFYTKRTRKIEKTIAFALSGSDQLVVVGPCDEVAITMHGTTDPFTPDATPVGLVRLVQTLQINSSVRGAIGRLTGISLSSITMSMFGPPSKPFFAAADGNAGVQHATTAGGALAQDGFSFIVPFGVEAGEICTFNFKFCDSYNGEIGVVASDLAGFAGTLRMSVSLNTPQTFWGFQTQSLGANGVIGAGASYTQTLPPVLPNFAIVGGVITALQNTLAPANNVVPPLANLIIVMGDDYLVNDNCFNIRALYGRRMGGFLNSALVAYRHTPVANDASYQVTVSATIATIAPSEICYWYQSGAIAPGVVVGGQAAAAPTTSGVVSTPNTMRALPVSAPAQGMQMNTGGIPTAQNTQGLNLSLNNLIGRRTP